MDIIFQFHKKLERHRLSNYYAANNVMPQTPKLQTTENFKRILAKLKAVFLCSIIMFSGVPEKGSSDLKPRVSLNLLQEWRSG